ncbi:hypothetical protein GHT06_018118 [Daphnia sinensis]|uniref:DUF4097 domain-containing protein n=1 Tax=Daphnia sinensis TaxID=1820382 RepID=A0AAD5LDC6_9CRUS|nr:hypothetical protein GHT06_018118 [Daphnia sinensis]
MPVFINRNSLSLINHLKTISKRNSVFPTNKNASVFNVFRHLQTSCKCQKDDIKLVKTVEKTVNPYGYLELNNLDLDVSIKPTCPNTFPDMNKVICSFYSKTEQIAPELIHQDEKISLQSNKVYHPKESYCSISIPIKYHVDSANILGHNNVHVESMESASVRITTGSGDITTNSLKGDFISLLTQTGNVKCSGLSQGRITIHSGSGDIHGHKFQGPALVVATNSGNVTAESVYSDESRFVSATGNITLKNLHRKCNVKITSTGNLTASGMDGSLDAQLGQGQHQIQISQLQENSSIRVIHGSLTLKVPVDCPFGIRVTAGSIVVTPEKMKGNVATNDECSLFEYQTDEEGQPIIEIEGKNSSVVIENQDWYTSLGLELQK